MIEPGVTELSACYRQLPSVLLNVALRQITGHIKFFLKILLLWIKIWFFKTCSSLLRLDRPSLNLYWLPFDLIRRSKSLGYLFSLSTYRVLLYTDKGTFSSGFCSGCRSCKPTWDILYHILCKNGSLSLPGYWRLICPIKDSHKSCFFFLSWFIFQILFNRELIASELTFLR